MSEFLQDDWQCARQRVCFANTRTKDTYPMCDTIRLRLGTSADVPFLQDMLRLAVCWQSGTPCPSLADLLARPELHRIVAEWGRMGDTAILAETEANSPVGAAWYRLWTPTHHSYGFVDPDTPELALAIMPAWRGRGLGTRLMHALIDHAQSGGYLALSLSVDPRNPARRLYEALGFVKVGETGTSWTMRLAMATARDIRHG